jgi:pentatricopeptide repeat protein
MIMEGLRPDKFTYNSLLTYFCKAGDIKKAADIVQTMASDGCEPDIVTYGTLIAGLCKAGRVEAATKLLRTIQMKGINLTPHAYNPVIQALFRRKRSKEAVRLFREMIEKAEAPDAVTYKIVFRGLCQGGGPIGEAVDFVMEMLERGYVPEFSSFYMLAEGLFSLAMVGTLIKLIDMVMEKAKFSDNEVTMIRGFLKISKYQDALATLGGILDSRKPNRAYR